MRVCIIGAIAFPAKDKNHKIKSINGVSGHVFELLNTLLSKNIAVDFVGKIFNYNPSTNLSFHEVQKNLTSTNKFLLNLFAKSFSIKLQKDTIIHAHRPDHLAAFTFFKNNPTIVTLHGQQAITVFQRKNFIIRFVFRSLEKIALKKAKYILATDIITSQYYRKIYPKQADKIRIIPTGVDLNVFKPLNRLNCRLKYRFNIEDKVIIYFGRIEPPKRIAEIIKAYQIIHKKNKLYKLLIVGIGKQLNEMKLLAQELGLQNNVFFLGPCTREELPELINCADISVLYSGNEGSPLSVKESLACGVPMVSNRVGDVDAIIQNGENGYIVDKENIDSLASAMEKCITNADSMKDFSVESCEAYSIEKINNRIVSIYKELIEKQNN